MVSLSSWVDRLWSCQWAVPSRSPGLCRSGDDILRTSRDPLQRLDSAPGRNRSRSARRYAHLYISPATNLSRNCVSGNPFEEFSGRRRCPVRRRLRVPATSWYRVLASPLRDLALFSKLDLTQVHAGLVLSWNRRHPERGCLPPDLMPVHRASPPRIRSPTDRV